MLHLVYSTSSRGPVAMPLLRRLLAVSLWTVCVSPNGGHHLCFKVMKKVASTILSVSP